jgi:hypothetical protein
MVNCNSQKYTCLQNQGPYIVIAMLSQKRKNNDIRFKRIKICILNNSVNSMNLFSASKLEKTGRNVETKI